MKKTKNLKKKIIIAVAIIIVAVLLGFLIAKTCAPHKGNTIGTTGDNNSAEGIITLEIVGPEEESNDEERAYAPAEIKNIVQEDGTTILTLDILTANPDFQPGVTDFFINQNPKLRDLAISKKAKAFNCEGTAPTASVSIADVIATMQQRLASDNGRLTYYFDIDDNKINTIYQQCLP